MQLSQVWRKLANHGEIKVPALNLVFMCAHEVLYMLRTVDKDHRSSDISKFFFISNEN